MTDAASEAKLRFMDAASHFYSSIAPATSALLSSQSNFGEASRARPLQEVGSSQACKACGTILIPSWTTRTSLNGHKVSNKPCRAVQSENRVKRKTAKPKQTFLRVDCLACHRYEQIPLSKPQSKGGLLNTHMSPLGAGILPDTSTLPNPVSQRSASKRRARARKKPGLQAMLEKSRAPAIPSSGFGLDLLDLMQQD